MTYTITLPRSVLEQALEALEMMGVPSPLVFLSDEIKLWQTVQVELRAALEQPQVEQEPIRWPANASEVRAFLSGHVAAERYARDDHQPDDSDTYTLSAHDLLGAIDWWTDFDSQPRQPLTDDQIAELMMEAWGCASIAPRHAPAFARAVEAAHGIKERK